MGRWESLAVSYLKKLFPHLSATQPSRQYPLFHNTQLTLSSTMTIIACPSLRKLTRNLIISALAKLDFSAFLMWPLYRDPSSTLERSTPLICGGGRLYPYITSKEFRVTVIYQVSSCLQSLTVHHSVASFPIFYRYLSSYYSAEPVRPRCTRLFTLPPTLSTLLKLLLTCIVTSSSISLLLGILEHL